MIESVFGIKNFGIEYIIEIEQFKSMIEYIIQKEFNLNSEHIVVDINSIHNETIFKIDSTYKKNIYKLLPEVKPNKTIENVFKSLILEKLFGTTNLEEEVLYTKGFHPKAKQIKFVVKN